MPQEDDEFLKPIESGFSDKTQRFDEKLPVLVNTPVYLGPEIHFHSVTLQIGECRTVFDQCHYRKKDWLPSIISMHICGTICTRNYSSPGADFFAHVSGVIFKDDPQGTGLWGLWVENNSFVQHTSRITIDFSMTNIENARVIRF